MIEKGENPYSHAKEKEETYFFSHGCTAFSVILALSLWQRKFCAIVLHLYDDPLRNVKWEAGVKKCGGGWCHSYATASKGLYEFYATFVTHGFFSLCNEKRLLKKTNKKKWFRKDCSKIKCFRRRYNVLRSFSKQVFLTLSFVI